jgi:hypothetical protein
MTRVYVLNAMWARVDIVSSMEYAASKRPMRIGGGAHMEPITFVLLAVVAVLSAASITVLSR